MRTAPSHLPGNHPGVKAVPGGPPATSALRRPAPTPEEPVDDQ